MVVRNENARLPFILRYYAERGVVRFFIIDNESLPPVEECLPSLPNVHVIAAEGSYAEARFGILWVRHLLNLYGAGHWCIVVDADEMLVYPEWERRSLTDLCATLDAEGSTALPVLLLDMYSDRPFASTVCEVGSDPLAVCPFYEVDSIICAAPWKEAAAGRLQHHGGMRKRVFGLNPRLDKVSLFQHSPGMTLSPGMHTLQGGRFSRMRGAALHFKYLTDFGQRAAIEAAREEHWSDALDYKRYDEALRAQPELGAYSDLSRRFTCSDDLIECGVLRNV